MERIGPLSRNFVLNQDFQDFQDFIERRWWGRHRINGNEYLLCVFRRCDHRIGEKPGNESTI